MKGMLAACLQTDVYPMVVMRIVYCVQTVRTASKHYKHCIKTQLRQLNQSPTDTLPIKVTLKNSIVTLSLEIVAEMFKDYFNKLRFIFLETVFFSLEKGILG